MIFYLKCAAYKSTYLLTILFTVFSRCPGLSLEQTSLEFECVHVFCRRKVVINGIKVWMQSMALVLILTFVHHLPVHGAPDVIIIIITCIIMLVISYIVGDIFWSVSQRALLSYRDNNV